LDTVLQQVEEWLKTMMIPVIMNQLNGLFDTLNSEVGSIASGLGASPSGFSPDVFNMIRNISETVIMPIAGMILTFVAVYELIQIIMSYNNLANFETWFIYKWVFKTFVAVELITHTFDFTMAVFDVAQHVILSAGGVIMDSVAVDASGLAAIESSLEDMSIWALIALFMQIYVIQFVTMLLSKLIFVLIYCRMIEIYMYVSMAPIPFATLGNKEQGQIGQNYIRSLFALGFQGFLIMICVGIYAMLIQTCTFSSDIIGSIWGVLGYTLLLAFSIFKSGAVAKSVLQAH
jgi:hypothetical protein